MKNKLLIFACAVVMALAGHQAGAEEKMLQVKGSDTMVHLSSAWAEAFMKNTPSLLVSVTGGGSGTGISALLNGTADIANSSRPMTSSEIGTAKGKGFTPKENIVGLDGIAIIVNPSCPVNSLTMEQLKKIFTGEVNNWKAVGGPNQKIMIFTRDSSSGTFAFFQEHVLAKADYSVKARRLASNSAIVQSVSEDSSGIGYVGLGYIMEAQGKVKVVPVSKNDQSAPVTPTTETVKNKTYPVSRGLFMYTKGEPAATAKTFMDFIYSSDGQKIVEELGFVSIK
jgi:phosphate transport system substrate-binding protein